MGAGKLSALPLSTPPDTGFIKGRGAGGGSLLATTTFRFASSVTLRISPAGGVIADTLSLLREVCGGRTTGFDGGPTASPTTAFAGAGELPGWSIFAIAASR